MLGCAVGRLQRNTSIGKSRSDLNNDTAIARQHSFERSQCSVNITEIGDLGYPFEFFRRHLFDRRKHRRHRVVDPDVDWTELVFEFACGLFHCRRVGHIGRQNQRFAAQPDDVATSAFQAFTPARDQPNARSFLGEGPGGSPAETG